MRMSDEMSEVFSSDLGATSGDTQVSVINRGGLGAPTIEGIKIVDVAGASNGTFALDGDYVFNGEQAVIAGAYGYRMYQGGVDRYSVVSGKSVAVRLNFGRRRTLKNKNHTS